MKKQYDKVEKITLIIGEFMQTLFNDKYKIIKTIGSGGMGTVYLAENVKLGTKWAIKAIPKKENARQS